MEREFTDREIERQDCVDNSIYNLVNELIPEAYEDRAPEDLGDGHRGLPWNIEWIAEIREKIEGLLRVELGIKPDEVDAFEMAFHPYVVLEDESSAAVWHRMEILTSDPADVLTGAEDVTGSGPIAVCYATNDDNDDGMPDAEVVRWVCRYKNLEAAVKATGHCRTGVSGCDVQVYLDGKRLTRELFIEKGFGDGTT